MKSISRSILVALLVALVYTPAVHATAPSPAGGTLVVTSLTTGFMTGTFDGPFVADLIQGQIERLVFEGNVCIEENVCKSGTVTFHIVNPVPNGLGYWTLQEGTGDLANLHGQGTWAIDMATYMGSYEGQIHFEGLKP